MQRPNAINIIGWIAVVSGATSLITPLLLASGEVRDMYAELGVSTQYMVGISLLSGAAQLVGGWALLQAKSWGRLVVLLYLPLAALLTGLLFQELFLVSLLPTLVMLGLVAYFLTRQPVNDFFAGTYDPQADHRGIALGSFRRAQRNSSDVARIFGILALCVSGFFLFMGFLMMGMFPVLADDPGAVPIVIGVFGLPAVVFGVAGVFLWGSRRWAESTGWLLAVVGVLGFVYGTMLWALARSDYWLRFADLQGVETEVVYVFSLISRGAFAASLLAVVGILLLWWQWSSDNHKLGPTGEG